MRHKLVAEKVGVTARLESSGQADAGSKGSTEQFASIGKIVAARWKDVSQEDLKRYKELAAQDMERYRGEMNAYQLKQVQVRRQKREMEERASSVPPPVSPHATAGAFSMVTATASTGEPASATEALLRAQGLSPTAAAALALPLSTTSTTPPGLHDALLASQAQDADSASLRSDPLPHGMDHLLGLQAAGVGRWDLESLLRPLPSGMGQLRQTSAMAAHPAAALSGTLQLGMHGQSHSMSVRQQLQSLPLSTLLLLQQQQQQRQPPTTTTATLLRDSAARSVPQALDSSLTGASDSALAALLRRQSAMRSLPHRSAQLAIESSRSMLGGSSGSGVLQLPQHQQQTSQGTAARYGSTSLLDALHMQRQQADLLSHLQQMQPQQQTQAAEDEVIQMLLRQRQQRGD